MKNDLVDRVSGLLNEFVAERDKSLEEAFTRIKQENGQVESTLNCFTEEYSRKVDDVMMRNQELGNSLEKKGEQCKRLRDGAFKSLGSVSDEVLEGLSDMQSLVTTSMSTYSTEITRQTHILSSASADAFERHARAKRARIDATEGLGTDIQAESGYLQRAIAAMSKSVEANASKTSKFARSAQVYQKSASEHLACMRKMTDSLVDQGSREDLPTGGTPRKRVWQYTDSWGLTKDRDAIIQDWKRGTVQSQDDGCGSSLRCLSPALPPDSLKHPVMSSVQVAARSADITEQPDPLPPPYLEADVEEPPMANFPLPLAPLIVPAVALPAAVSNPTMKTKIGKSGSDVISAMGTLTERSTNLIYGRGARRAR
ncbi:hypothetical protein BJV78DRAFT_303837 [Lactifluus subvellereus]|nr:hypothetical protein BJV78DRAFT_303837 [Lactifluus subvellereus]